MPCLAFNLNNGKEFIFDLVERRLSLGRNLGNEIVVENSYISSFHAEITHSDSNTYHISDLSSANGTFVNGERIEHAVLKNGDILRFGQLEATLRETKRITTTAKLSAKFVSPVVKTTSTSLPRKATKALRLAKHSVPPDSRKSKPPLSPPARPYVQNLAPTMLTAPPVSKPAPELRPVSENERISDNITDLQEKHDFLARKLSTHLDEQTVIIFPNDLIKRLDIDPSEFLMIGNSLKSDILPVLGIGGYAIHIPFHTTWAHERIDYKVEHINFRDSEKISDVLAIIRA